MNPTAASNPVSRHRVKKKKEKERRNAYGGIKVFPKNDLAAKWIFLSVSTWFELRFFFLSVCFLVG